MPCYEFACNCGMEWEEVRPMSECGVAANCPECGSLGRRVFSIPSIAKDQLYHFTDTNTFSRPVHVRGKDHWKKLLKEHAHPVYGRLHDDVSQSKPLEIKHKKPDRAKIKEVAVSVLKENKVI